MKLSRKETRIIDSVLEMQGGYLLDFSNASMAEFFDDEFGLDLEESIYLTYGTSKAKRFRAFMEQADDAILWRVLKKLYEYRTENSIGDKLEKSCEAQFLKIIEKLEGNNQDADTDFIEPFERDETLNELIDSIKRDIEAEKIRASIDRLHTYSVKKFRYLLKQRGLSIEKTLGGDVGKYFRSIREDPEIEISDVGKKIMKQPGKVFDDLNELRNKKTMAHDNDLLSESEARYYLDAVGASMRFIKSIEKTKFESPD